MYLPIRNVDDLRYFPNASPAWVGDNGNCVSDPYMDILIRESKYLKNQEALVTDDSITFTFFPSVWDWKGLVIVYTRV